MNLKPIGDRVVVQRQEAGEKTKGGIILPDAAKEKPQMGKILAVGDPALGERIAAWQRGQREQVLADDRAVQGKTD